MLYLAEVQKQSSKFGLGGGRTELKLLACQRGENNWTAVPGDDVILADDASNFKDGTLVLVDLNTSKQVQRIQEAARQLVGILQDFSRLQEKFKTQQEEIEQWKESLTYQSQELNRREMEMEARREQMEQLEEELERLEQQRQEIERSRDDSSRLYSEIEQARQEIEAARQQLQTRQAQIEEQQAQLQSTPSLSSEQSQTLNRLLTQLSTPLTLSPIQQRLNQSLEQVTNNQDFLDQHWQRLRTTRAEAEQLQQTVEGLTQTIEQQWQQWRQDGEVLMGDRAELTAQQRLLQVKQDYAKTLRTQLDSRQTLLEQLREFASRQSEDDSATVNVKVDVPALEAMPLDQLQAEVQKLEQEWDRWFRLVKEQEEELKYKLEGIEELQEKLKSSNGSEREELQTELTDEQDAYQMLNETLVGQRRTLKEREEYKTQYQAVLLRRQGLPPTKTGGTVDLSSMITNLETQQQQQQQELQTLETEIQQFSAGTGTLETEVTTRVEAHEQMRQQLETQKQTWLEQQRVVAELWGRVSLYQEMLQPLQDTWGQIRQLVQETTTDLNQVLELSTTQTQATTQLQQVLGNLL